MECILMPMGRKENKGAAVCWGTSLRDGRCRVRFPIGFFEIF